MWQLCRGIDENAIRACAQFVFAVRKLFYFSFHVNFFLLFAELLYKMVCEPDETDLNMHIPAVMLPLDAGTRLEKMLTTTSSGELPCACFVDL